MSTEITDALRRGDTEKALAAARRLVKAEPDNAEAQYLLGLALQRAGDGNGGLAAFQQAVVLAPDRPAYAFALASLALGLGQLDLAEKHARLASGLDPNFLPAYALAGQAALMRRDRGEAENQLKLAQRVNPNHPLSLLLEGHLARFDGDEERAMRLFMAVVKADGSLSAAHLALGLGFLRQGQVAFAEKALANAHALAPTNVTVAHALLQALRAQGKHHEALALVEELAVGQPGNLTLRLMRDELMVGTGRRLEALDDLRNLLREQPAHPQALGMALEILRLEGRAEEGQELAEAALAKAPTDDRLWVLRGALAASLREDGKPLLDRWLQVAPQSPVAWEQLAGYHESEGQSGAAVEAAKRALSLSPGLAGATLVLVRATIDEDPAGALAALETVRLPAGEVHVLRSTLGWRAMALDRLNRYDEAASVMRELVRHQLPEEVPPPQPLPANGQPRASAGSVFWALPGVRVEGLLASLRGLLGQRLKPRADALVGAGDDQGVTWLPFVDAQAVHDLDGVRWLALVADPRDALLAWMLFGSTQRYRFTPDPRAAARWLQASLQALLDLRAKTGDRVHWLHQDRDLTANASEISRVLGIGVDRGMLEARPAPGVRPFQAGHWRHYRQAFAEEFAVLAPVAQALGYPAE